MIKKIMTAFFVLFFIGWALPAFAWFGILNLKWDEDPDVNISGYIVKVKMIKTSGQITNYQKHLDRVQETKIDVFIGARHEISIIPIVGGVEKDPIYDLIFTPKGIPRSNDTIKF